MSESMRESLSALMDDEANELELERVLAGIGDDQALRQVWVRYHLARESTGLTPALASADISGRVRAALDTSEQPATTSLRESLSALMDDEANELELERVLSRIGDDQELRQDWVRYHLARESTGLPPALASADISDRVRAALDAGEQSVPAESLRQRLLRPVASFAVAASVAATVVIGGQQLAQIGAPGSYGPEGGIAASPSAVGMINTVGATPVQASFGTTSVPVLQPATRTAYQEMARQRMGRYLQDHAEHAALNSPQGLIPYARVQEISE